MLRWEESPISRSGFVFTFRAAPPEPKPGTPIPDYNYLGEVVASYFSVLFGKRFDDHGLIESHGMFQLPNMAAFGGISHPRLPQNSHQPRRDFGFPLNFDEVRRLEPLINGGEIDQAARSTFDTAAKFYYGALQAVERDPEVAYLHLITAGEILAEGSGIDSSDLLDEQIATVLDRISVEMKEGEKVARLLKGRLRQLKRKFAKALCSSLDDDFFAHSESEFEWGRLKSDDIETRLRAAYDLRSRYVHVGVPFGRWIAPTSNLNELQVGRPVVPDRELSDILATAPTYLGLERVVRHCLVKALGRMGMDLELIPVPKQ